MLGNGIAHGITAPWGHRPRFAPRRTPYVCEKFTRDLRESETKAKPVFSNTYAALLESYRKTRVTPRATHAASLFTSDGAGLAPGL